MAGYTKLFSSIITSTIWQEDDATRLVWITMLATADAHGVVEGSLPGLAHIARVPVDECARALKTLESADAHSRTPEHEGRRIEKVDGGWKILNYAYYREKGRSQDRREYYRQYHQERRKARAQRARARTESTGAHHSARTAAHRQSPSAEAVKEKEKEKEKCALTAADSTSKPPLAEPRVDYSNLKPGEVVNGHYGDPPPKWIETDERIRAQDKAEREAAHARHVQMMAEIREGKDANATEEPPQSS